MVFNESKFFREWRLQIVDLGVLCPVVNQVGVCLKQPPDLRQRSSLWMTREDDTKMWNKLDVLKIDFSTL